MQEDKKRQWTAEMLERKRQIIITEDAIRVYLWNSGRQPSVQYASQLLNKYTKSNFLPVYHSQNLENILENDTIPLDCKQLKMSMYPTWEAYRDQLKKTMWRLKFQMRRLNSINSPVPLTFFCKLNAIFNQNHRSYFLS
jgi:hypothetical protein